jgi:amphi-Trp domain-containing protein
MRREELVGWLEEVARQLKTGTLLIDGERVAIPEEVKSRIKTKDKKGRSSLKLQLEWETKPPKEAQKKDKKISEAVPHNDQKPERKTGAGPAAMVRDYDSHILVCAGGDCKKRGSKGVRKALRDELRASGTLDDARIDTVDCLGLCKHGPNVVVYDGAEPKGFWYLGLEEADVPEVVEQHLKGGAPRAHLLADRRPRKAKKIKNKRPHKHTDG